jgi:hypothetical protein
MDEQLQDLVRAARATGEPEATRRAVAACERAGQSAPADLVDRVTWPARTVTSDARLEVYAEDVTGATSFHALLPPDPIELGEHRVWSVVLKSVPDEPLWEELARLEVPGIRGAVPGKDAPRFAARAGRLPTLRRFSLTSGVGDEALAELGVRPLLADLRVDSLKLTSLGLASLRAPHLVRLSLQRTNKVRDLSCLGGMQLRRLSLRSLRVGPKLIKTLPALPELTHLEVSKDGITARVVDLLAERLPGLRELIVTPGEGEQTSFLEALASFTRLESLTLHGPRRLVVADLAPLAALTQLRSLDLDVSDVPTIEALSELGSLRRLVVRRPDDGALRRVAAVSQLRELAILFPEPGTTRAGMAVIGQLPQLEHLALGGDRLASADELLEAVQAMCPDSLRRLRLDHMWGNATAILPRLALPNVDVAQEPLVLAGDSAPQGWRVA